MFKWVGSKRRLADEIIAHMPRKIENYVEPFMGAAHVGLSLLESKAISGKVYFSDNNDDLISFWLSVQNDPEQLVSDIKQYNSKLNKKDYAKIRRQRPISVTKKGARFYYLIKNSYRGLWRVNSDNEYNVSFCGCSEDSFKPDELEFKKTSLLLDPSRVSIEVMDFRDALKRNINNAVYYLDPPYYNTFAAYTIDKFLKHDHVVLNMHFEKLKRAGNVVVLSNSDEPFIRDLYKDHEIFEVNIKHSTSCTNGSEEKTELIIK